MNKMLYILIFPMLIFSCSDSRMHESLSPVKIGKGIIYQSNHFNRKEEKISCPYIYNALSWGIVTTHPPICSLT